MAGFFVPGARTWRWNLLPAIRLRLLMHGGGLMPSAVRSLHGSGPNAGYAKNPKEQHQNARYLAHSRSDSSRDHTPHMGSIAVPFLPCNQDFSMSRVAFS